jgi:2'-5' RNA ligase
VDATKVRGLPPAQPSVGVPPARRAPDDSVVNVGVAIGVPEPWGSQLSQSRAATGDPLAPFVPAHVTLLGPTEVDRDALPAIERHLEEVASTQRPFAIRLRGTGTFRPVTEVVFVAVASGISRCEQLSVAVRSGPLRRKLHFPYHPHVTVAHDIPTAALDAVFEELADFNAKFAVDRFTLYVHGADLRWGPVRDFPLGPVE